jgi:hypothetical protein
VGFLFERFSTFLAEQMLVYFQGIVIDLGILSVTNWLTTLTSSYVNAKLKGFSRYIL